MDSLSHQLRMSINQKYPISNFKFRIKMFAFSFTHVLILYGISHVLLRYIVYLIVYMVSCFAYTNNINTIHNRQEFICYVSIPKKLNDCPNLFAGDTSLLMQGTLTATKPLRSFACSTFSFKRFQVLKFRMKCPKKFIVQKPDNTYQVELIVHFSIETSKNFIDFHRLQATTCF